MEGIGETSAAASQHPKPIVIPAHELENQIYVKCPYFPEHEMPKSRLGYHLIKCQKKPNAPRLVVCPFNYLHRVKSELINKHTNECEDRKYFQDVLSAAPSFDKTRLAFHNGQVKAGWEIAPGDEVW